MMSGALWVRDQLVDCGWQVEVADARRVKTVAPLAAKTDKVDARLLAELSRRELVPALWLPSLDERALRERLRRRMHLVRLRTSAKGRIFGLQTQWGVRVSLARLRRADGLTLLERAGVPEVWRRSVSECLALIDFLDARLEPLDAELRPFAKADPRAVLLDTIPGIAELLALTIAVEVGEISRFASPEKLVSYGRLAPRVRQSGQARPRSGPLSKSGSRLLGFARLTAPHGIEKPRQLPPTRCAPKRQERDEHPTVREHQRRCHQPAENLTRRPFFRKSPAVATSGNRWQTADPRKRREQAKTGPVGCHWLPEGADGWRHRCLAGGMLVGRDPDPPLEEPCRVAPRLRGQAVSRVVPVDLLGLRCGALVGAGVSRRDELVVARVQEEQRCGRLPYPAERLDRGHRREPAAPAGGRERQERLGTILGPGEVLDEAAVADHQDEAADSMLDSGEEAAHRSS